jgi:predicted RND superfamily exporter protein
MNKMNTLWWLIDLFIVIGVMLLGMTIALTYDYEVWQGALSGLIVHRVSVLTLRRIRKYARL